MSQTIKGTAEIFKAMGDETRLKIIKLIAATGNNICVGMIASKLDISQPAVSQHLKILKNAGLIDAERQGMYLHYKIVDDFLAPYDIDTQAFLRSFGAEFELESFCELKGKTEACGKLNR